MKKITLLFTVLFSAIGFSQSNTEKIQQYLNDNRAKLGLTSQDVQQWFIESELSSETTGINNYFVKQKHEGIELYNSVSNFWIKNNRVINGGEGLISNISQKVNTTHPTLSVMQALNSANNLLGIETPYNQEVTETIDAKNFRISNGTETAIKAKLVYQLTEDNALRLAWDFTIDIKGNQHLWSVRIDALDGKVLDKHDMVISCRFGDIHDHNNTCTDNSKAFTNSFFKPESSSILQVNAGSYRVIPYNYASPDHIARQLITSPSNALASPNGWHNSNSLTGTNASLIYTTARGNNVFALEDADGDSATVGATANGGASLNFDFPYGGTFTQPTSYVDAAVTNLFYMNNIMHDVWYQYGFNELNGNFQQHNLGRGTPFAGAGDSVLAEAQDGSALNPQNLNNANFSTPVDGTPGRMQMFLWNAAPPLQPIYINSPSDIVGLREARDNAFSPGHVDIPVAPALVQSDFVLYDDGTADAGTTDNADACGPAVNAAALNGKIVLVRRSLAEASGGTPCSFIEKVKNAQNAGAIGVIIVNNVAGAINMSGADATVTIPALSVTQAVGEALIARVKLETVNGKIQLPNAPYVNADGDFDNGIIAHEYGHGISTRLAGGPNNSSCLTNYEAMGEGWSDWFALMMQVKTGDVGTTALGMATFALGQPTTGSGLRQYPYSTDMSVNPLTFTNTNTPVPTDPSNTGYRYVMGEFWATTLWDLSWAYITKYGFNSNIYTGTGGNNKVMGIVLAALKLQPCNPSIVDGRNAIIAADQAATGGQDYCLITEVFRRRGLGLNATSGGANNPNDQVQSFTAYSPGPNCTTVLGNEDFQNQDMFKVYPNPTNGDLNIRITNFTGKVTIQIVDLNGRIIKEYKNTDFNVEKTLNINDLQSGMYLVKVANDDLNFTKKIIKN